ncbi:MAG: alkylation repair enzyme [Armatimonadetes bacterium]|nr:alkylation repair enzyme [Armatimonadota bacterium]
MTAAEIMTELEGLGTAGYRKVLFNHGVQEPVYGVKISELKIYQKRIKKDYELALDLYATGNYDAQYLAGLIADAHRMTEADLRLWLDTANCSAIAASSVAWVAAESRHGWDLAREWIDSGDEVIAQTGWMTLSSLVSIREDSAIDVEELERLLARVERTIHQQPNRARYAMNGFVIAAGCYVRALTEPAIQAGERIGVVSVDMGNTACEVPFAPDYIRKVITRGTIGKKRRSARC